MPAPAVPTFPEWLLAQKYAPTTARMYASFMRTAEKNNPPVLLDDAMWDTYVSRYALSSQPFRTHARTAYLRYLYDVGDIDEYDDGAPTPVSKDVEAFSRWLIEAKGLAASTAAQYASRAKQLAEWLEANPTLPVSDFLRAKSPSYEAVLHTAWRHYTAWMEGKGESADPLLDALPNNIVAIIGRLHRRQRIEAKELNVLTWGDLEYTRVSGVVTTVRIPVPDGKPGHYFRAIRGREGMADLQALWAWAAPPHEAAPLIPRRSSSTVPAGVRRINKAIKKASTVPEGE